MLRHIGIQARGDFDLAQVSSQPDLTDLSDVHILVFDSCLPRLQAFGFIKDNRDLRTAFGVGLIAEPTSDQYRDQRY